MHSEYYDTWESTVSMSVIAGSSIATKRKAGFGSASLIVPLALDFILYRNGGNSADATPFFSFVGMQATCYCHDSSHCPTL
jgi:hypothetical protein